MDGCFGLVQKLKFETLNNPLYQSKFLCDQNLVDALVVEDAKKTSKPADAHECECSNFTAGDVLNSMMSNPHLLVKGVFG